MLRNNYLPSPFQIEMQNSKSLTSFETSKINMKFHKDDGVKQPPALPGSVIEEITMGTMPLWQ